MRGRGAVGIAAYFRFAVAEEVVILVAGDAAVVLDVSASLVLLDLVAPSSSTCLQIAFSSFHLSSLSSAALLLL